MPDRVNCTHEWRLLPGTGERSMCQRCGVAEWRVLRAEIERLREALDEIADGVGCDAKYGPGCDTHCKTIARAALARGKPEGGT